MKCLLIFDHLNDIIFTKYDNKFAEHINEFAQVQGLYEKETDEQTKINENVIVQIFSPIITSQRIMNCQFGNSYTSIQCEDDLNMCFDEYMGYLFVNIERNNVPSMNKFLSICITIVRYLCGPDVYQLKSNEDISETVTNLIDSWLDLYENEQAINVEAVEQLMVNSDLSSTALQALQKSVNKLIPNVECNKIHAMVLVQNKFLSLYSSQNAKELSPVDILFCTIFSNSCTTTTTTTTTTTHDTINSYQILLAGPDNSFRCLPHVIHIIKISEGINLIYLLEIGNSAISSSIYETFCQLHTMQLIQIQHDIETLRPAFDHLDLAIKHLNDSLKKIKNNSIEVCYKQLMKKWEIIRKKYLQFIKTKTDEEALLRAETLALGFLENLKELLSLTSSADQKILINSRKFVLETAEIVCEQLNGYDEFFRVKAIRNFTLGSDSLTINKYLEEFPGIVHFIYIDRNSHRMTAPTLDLDETNSIIKNKIWDMINFVRIHLQEGNLSIIWKDTAYSYAYFLWFEDINGTPLKPTVFPTNSNKALPIPGLLGEDFYRKLKEVCFPRILPNKIRCYELFCIHLGVVTASCVLEHTRRLAATICELREHSLHPIDLL